MFGGRRADAQTQQTDIKNPLAILKERLTRGEITLDDYERIRVILGEERTPSPTAPSGSRVARYAVTPQFEPQRPRPAVDPLVVLRERYALGEINRAEVEQRLEGLLRTERGVQPGPQ